jgi:sugar lactone lactonase YvrE
LTREYHLIVSENLHKSLSKPKTYEYLILPKERHITDNILLKICLRLFVDSPLLIGVTVAGYGNGTAGTALNALNSPWGLALDVNDSLYVADFINSRVMKLQAGSLTGSIVAGTGVYGSNATQLRYPAELAVDANSNIYVNDDYNYRVMLWHKNSSSGVRVAGSGTSGSTNNTIGLSAGLAVDSQGNIYVSDQGNHRIMKWAPNATFGTLVAGMTGVHGNSSQLLYKPYGLYLDETNSYLYIADWGNNRIQRYSVNVTTNGTTVAGGNGAGSGSDQFNQPYGVCVSKTGDIYIADEGNHRIQRWSPGASSGVTIVGITGVSGTNATMLNAPAHVALSKNETFLYVSDTNNHRVQRFNLT